LRIPFEVMKAEFRRVLVRVGFAPDKAELCAGIFAQNSLDGVYSHGLNRFPKFISDIRNGCVIADARPEKTAGFGGLENWDGKRGPGNLNARFAMNRAIELAGSNGIGCVALKNTNHWMRGGTYGWQAAEAGCIGICWTNTMPLLPPWGSAERKLGNNPLVIAVPREGGPVVLDMAMTVFSLGKIESYILKNALLPVEGGFDAEGNITNDPRAISESKRLMPVGYWKGTGLALVLDLMALILSGGHSTLQLGQAEQEGGVSQVFLAIDLMKLPQRESVFPMIEDIIDDLHSAKPITAEDGIYYPGERALATRRENLEEGIPVVEKFWQQVLAM
jgi:3-dehydro-L-gulonate 2-dehydrogenase